ncbi:hypothetical protein ACP179_00490 (plasmid) [Xenorhabdus stockiae]|uniref:hypothetical protein n=1 Tax=Xenorhabdus stockiae TaxID=351614 RepID=UPI003CFB4D92
MQQLHMPYLKAGAIPSVLEKAMLWGFYAVATKKNATKNQFVEHQVTRKTTRKKLSPS